jgi:hypothetical protein
MFRKRTNVAAVKNNCEEKSWGGILRRQWKSSGGIFQNTECTQGGSLRSCKLQ